jgi:hypothetical protein
MLLLAILSYFTLGYFFIIITFFGLFYAIFDYCKLFHFRLFAIIDYFWLLKVILS